MQATITRRAGLIGLCSLAAAQVAAQVPVSEVEQFYSDPAVFTPVEPVAHAHATRFPSLSADGRRIAFASDGQNQIVVRDLFAGSSEVVAAPGLVSRGRDFTLSPDGQLLAFASDALPGKSSCGRQVNLRNMLTGSAGSVGGAACLEQPSKPVAPQLGKPFGYASNIRNNGLPSPSNSYDLYFRRNPPPFGKASQGDDEPDA